jgi:hypothetical protein
VPRLSFERLRDGFDGFDPRGDADFRTSIRPLRLNQVKM